MRKKEVGMAKVLSTVLVFLLVGCGSSSIPFVGGGGPFKGTVDFEAIDEGVLRAFARDVEGAVAAGNREYVLEDSEVLVVNTSAIAQAIKTRAARQELLVEFMDTGFLYEQQGGLVSIIRSGDYGRATTRNERDRNALLVIGENQNRWAVYEGLLKANNLSRKSLPAIRTVFFEARLGLLGSGHYYEDGAGNRVAK
jgi:hypothetical protein